MFDHQESATHFCSRRYIVRPAAVQQHTVHHQYYHLPSYHLALLDRLESYQTRTKISKYRFLGCEGSEEEGVKAEDFLLQTTTSSQVLYLFKEQVLPQSSSYYYKTITTTIKQSLFSKEDGRRRAGSNHNVWYYVLLGQWYGRQY